mmetsp:Transcript_119225/g.380059  ORF Transcript_119225/g.380059 Transcript_119225/m.380059 type:complete len:210 (-) Transcript_119225:263-892(-)
MGSSGLHHFDAGGVDAGPGLQRRYVLRAPQRHAEDRDLEVAARLPGRADHRAAVQDLPAVLSGALPPPAPAPALPLAAGPGRADPGPVEGGRDPGHGDRGPDAQSGEGALDQASRAFPRGCLHCQLGCGHQGWRPAEDPAQIEGYPRDLCEGRPDTHAGLFVQWRDSSPRPDPLRRRHPGAPRQPQQRLPSGCCWGLHASEHQRGGGRW